MTTSKRARVHEIVFEADTPAGKAFDVALLVAIVVSVAAVMLESVDSIRDRHGVLLARVEWGFTLLFTTEYLVRLWSVGRPLRYATSFFGLIDLLAILPSYIGLFFTGGQAFLVIRVMRLLRVFRVLKLVQFVAEAGVLKAAIKGSVRKIIIFLGFVVSLAAIMGSVMYLVEHNAKDSTFSSIPQSMYWAIVTMTTVGYGDIAPTTVFGKFLASCLMILGYAVIAVPTGIVSVELAQAQRRGVSTQSCPSCSAEGHDPDARHCKYCGHKL